MSDVSVRLDAVMPLIRQQLSQGGTVQFTPQGTSMRPMLEGGRDQVILAPIKGKLKKYDLPLYQRENGQYVLHRIVKVKDTYTCVGDNQFAYEQGLRQEQMLAVVTGFVRKEKYYSTDTGTYKLYCRLWHWSRFLRRCVRQCKGLFHRVFKRKP